MNKADKYQQNTSLHWAVTSGNNIAVKLLIEAGADLNAINEKVIPLMTLSFRTDRSGQTVQTQIRLLLEEQSDQGLHCLLFHLHHFDKMPLRFGLFVCILGRLQQRFLVSQNLGTLPHLVTKKTSLSF